ESKKPQPSAPIMAGAERRNGTSRTFRRVVPSERSSRMKKLILLPFALVLVISIRAFAQETAKPGEMKQDTAKAEKASAKAVRLPGKISADGEFSTEGKVGSSGPARQGARVSVRAGEKDGLRKLSRALQSFGFRLISDWYDATHFTPAISRLAQ